MGLVPDTFAPKTGGPSPQRGPHAGKGYSRRNGALQSSWACRRTDTLLRDLWFGPFVVHETISLGTAAMDQLRTLGRGVGTATCSPRPTKSVRGAHLASWACSLRARLRF